VVLDGEVMTTDLDYLDRLCSEATPGPWATIGCDKHLERVDLSCFCVRASVDGKRIRDVPDLLFIAAARTALPDLVAEVRRLRALLTEAVGALADLGACPDADCPRCESVMARCIAALEET
jgi:hypothetical protein